MTADEKDKMDRFALSGMDGGVHRRAAGHRGVFPVSYTHLDVYKRQPMDEEDGDESENGDDALLG